MTLLLDPAYPLSAQSAADASDHARCQADAEAACARIAPLWPLENFVAVNPFVGLADHHFLDACALVRRTTHSDMLMARAYYRRQWQTERILPADLQVARQQARQTLPATYAAALDQVSVATLTASLEDSDDSREADKKFENAILSVADWLDRERRTSWSGFIVDEVSKWCSAYYDQGQAVWRMPWRNQPLFTAWRAAALQDANPEVMGLRGFRAFVAALPDDAASCTERLLHVLPMPSARRVDFLHRQLMTISGWSGFVQYRVRENTLRGQPDDSLRQLLAIRLVYDAALFAHHDTAETRRQWADRITRPADEPHATPDLLTTYLWQAADETAYQRRLMTDLQTAAVGNDAAAPAQSGETRPEVQAVFCIDVRSERFRRAFEAAAPGIETLGFAGFFGFPLEVVPVGARNGRAQCPVLMTPRFRIRESLPGESPDAKRAARRRLLFSWRLRTAWHQFKTSAVSCFSFVETGGLLSGAHLIKESLCLSADKPRHPMTLEIAAEHPNDSPAGYGIAPDERVLVAAGALKNMNLTRNFARLVVICGHGSTTANNPYGSGLDCGACGGHSGQANARVAAAVFNDPFVRVGLHEQHGITIPEDTYFLAALHNTTTDDVTFFDARNLPATHAADQNRLTGHLETAARRTRQERAASLGLAHLPADRVDRQVRARSRHWAQTRPEWGLAGNAAFIAAPRARTKPLDLGGRVFLNNYEHAADPDLSRLELILTAPMIVASWINLQYFASTVNNRQFGSGDKTIHNVVAALGVWQGNSGDLQVGLPLQSVHDGRRWMHEPLRLSVFIEAPRAAIATVLQKHDNVRQLLDNQWLHLIAMETMENQGCAFARYHGADRWEPVIAASVQQPQSS